MRIATPYHEDSRDFTTATLICADCEHETAVVGPVPADARCARCGGATLARIPAGQQQSAAQRTTGRAA